jgi:hypothetical protein
MTTIRYRLTPGTADEKLYKASVASPILLTALIREIIERGRTNIVKRTPVGWSGALRGGYAIEVRRANTTIPVGIIANPIQYHDIREEGRLPGRRPPVDALIPWVGSKLGVPPGPERRSIAFLVARKIGAQGYEGAHMVEEGWEETRGEIKPRLKELGLKLVKFTGTSP